MNYEEAMPDYRLQEAEDQHQESVQNKKLWETAIETVRDRNGARIGSRAQFYAQAEEREALRAAYAGDTGVEVMDDDGNVVGYTIEALNGPSEPTANELSQVKAVYRELQQTIGS
ncbi:hypothetical protein DF051_30975 [Burkholderia contaminans]|uniref:Uncharacterized protein n=2 Tax=Burkholderia contaminans TaxID=488447 RepID=A0A3N8PBF5_9BURK|nr:hypothetical protein DF051_30975 [Burkholderia contaminans]